MSQFTQSAEVVFDTGQSVRLPSAYQTGSPPHIVPLASLTWRLAPTVSSMFGVRSASRVPKIVFVVFDSRSM